MIPREGCGGEVMDIVDKDLVDSFLKTVEKYIRSGKYSFYREDNPYYREKHLDAIARLGMSITQMEEEILELTYDDYREGPSDNHKPGEEPVWIFKRIINGEPIYIKLRDSYYNAKKKEVVIHSFHKDR